MLQLCVNTVAEDPLYVCVFSSITPGGPKGTIYGARDKFLFSHKQGNHLVHIYYVSTMFPTTNCTY